MMDFFYENGYAILAHSINIATVWKSAVIYGESRVVSVLHATVHSTETFT